MLLNISWTFPSWWLKIRTFDSGWFSYCATAGSHTWFILWKIFWYESQRYLLPSAVGFVAGLSVWWHSVLRCLSCFLKGSETLCGGAETAADRKSSSGETDSHSDSLRASCPLCWLVSPRWYPPHPDGAAPLQWGAAAGQGHAGVSGHRGLPGRLESDLEGGRRRRQQQLEGEQEPRPAGEGRSLHLEQHPEAPRRPVEERGLRELRGRSGVPDSSLRDPEERPVFPDLSCLTGTVLLVSASNCFPVWPSLVPFCLYVSKLKFSCLSWWFQVFRYKKR